MTMLGQADPIRRPSRFRRGCLLTLPAVFGLCYFAIGPHDHREFYFHPATARAADSLAVTVYAAGSWSRVRISGSPGEQMSAPYVVGLDFTGPADSITDVRIIIRDSLAHGVNISEHRPTLRRLDPRGSHFASSQDVALGPRTQVFKLECVVWNGARRSVWTTDGVLPFELKLYRASTWIEALMGV